MEFKAYINKYQLISFFVLTFCLSWIFWIPGVLLYIEKFQQVESALSFTSFPELILLQTLGAVGPSIVALWLIRFLHGKGVVKRVFSRYKKWRVGMRWFIIAIFLMPVITLLSIIINITILGNSILPNSSLGRMINSLGILGIIIMFPLLFISQLISSPLLEEFGWRGFALPKLQERFSALFSGVILGLLWGVWHLPLWLAYGLSTPILILDIIATSIIMTWVFNNTEGSMLIVLFFHASLNVSLNFFSIGIGGWVKVILAWLLVLVLIWRYGWQSLSTSEKYRWSNVINSNK